MRLVRLEGRARPHDGAVTLPVHVGDATSHEPAARLPHVPRRAASSITGLLAVVGLLITGCGDDDAPASQDAYCELVGLHLAELSAPAVSTPEDVERTLTIYREMADAAPLAVEQEWRTVLGSVETAATVDLDDPASVQRASDAARSSRADADRLLSYTLDLCGQTFDEVPSTPAVTAEPTTTTTSP